LDRTVQKVGSALLSYGLQAKVLGQRLTPNAALVHLMSFDSQPGSENTFFTEVYAVQLPDLKVKTYQGSDRLRANDVEHRREELLTTHGLPIANVLAEPGQVVVAVTRPQRQVVHLVDVWRNRTVDGDGGRSNRRLVLGVRESNGDTLFLQPGESHAPHTLIAGTTGSGKSILLQNLLLDIAATNDCSAAKIVLIDPKQGADYLELQGLPHIVGGITVTQDAAQQALEGAVAEMERRYVLFRRAGVANLGRYNAKVQTSERLPVLWVVHDEFAVWMLTDDYKDMVSSIVQRLGVMARAAGIFLIFAAQRPEDRVMPLQLRDNLGNRLVLRVESPGTSRIALGEEGAERLLGLGHLAARLPDEDRTILAQVPILRTEEIAEVVQSIREDSSAR
jgi:S-DNA-T family DNA segregation ATPase FtsK/SpoIIIE